MTQSTLLEYGISETRAVVLEDGEPIEYRLERPGVRVGIRAPARLLRREGARAFVLIDQTEALLDPAPPDVPEGATLMVEVRREAIPEPGRPRLARAVALPPGTAPRPGLTLAQTLPAPVHTLASHGPDQLEAAGWSEAIEAARTGLVAFPGGTLSFTRTPAFLVVDVDGPGTPYDTARAAAPALSLAIRRFDLGGSIVVDMPTLADRAQRAAIGELLDQHLPTPFERTAMNGFGLVQIVRPKLRPSLLDHVQAAPALTAALIFLRQAERTPGTGTTTLTAHPEIARQIEPAHLAELTRRTGRPARLHADPALAIFAGHAHVQP